MAARNILETAYRIVTGKRVLITIGMLVVLMITGSVYQMLASSADNRTFPAPGRLVDVGGYRMHIHCTGEAKSGAPTVILDHGGGAFGSLDWSVVQPVLSKSVRVCAYDRPGYGWSDTSPKPRTARSAAEELHTLARKRRNSCSIPDGGRFMGRILDPHVCNHVCPRGCRPGLHGYLA